MSPILGIVIGKVAQVALEKVLNRTTSNPQEAVQQAVSEVVESNPVVLNELNQEKAWQSRVVVGGTSAVIGAVGVILVELTQNNFPAYDWSVLGPSLVTVIGGAYALYGRLSNGLKPLFS